MKLTDMKQSKRDRKKSVEAAPMSDELYSYGLRLNLEDHDLKKLGIDKLPAVGDEMIVAAVGVVVNVSEHSSERSKNRSVSIQLQKLDVGPAKESTAVDAVSDAIKDS